MAKIPTTIITGFLGAGKTTLIRNLLEQSKGKQIALIINEFGDLGIDGNILNHCGIKDCDESGIIELTNGCICCTVAEDFTPAMEQLISRTPQPDHIIIETSGLALPQPLVRAFNWPEIRSRVSVDGVIVVVDGPAVLAGQFVADSDAIEKQRQDDENLSHETPLSELFEDQMVCADLVVVNKTDLISEDEVEHLLSEISRVSRDGTKAIKSQMGKVDPKVILGLGIGSEKDVASRHEIHHHHGEDDDHDHEDFESLVLKLPPIDNPERFKNTLREAIIEHNLLRVKGFGTVSGSPMRMVIQAVGPRIDSYFDRPLNPGEPNDTRLVIIGETGIKQADLFEMLDCVPV
ncbi:MAG: cobalamin biosynthesis protein CobW [Rhodobacteraceae bacterium]|nr:cobalamin biosynthesis protein CobW [Paracoccaceae bacterium]